jgi:hypothetical protein
LAAAEEAAKAAEEVQQDVEQAEATAGAGPRQLPASDGQPAPSGLGLERRPERG